MSDENTRRIEQLEEKIKELDEKVEKLRSATLKLIDMYEDHIKGKWTLEEIKVALSNINELVGLLSQAGVLNSGNSDNWLKQLIAQEYIARSRAPQEDVEVKRLSKKQTNKIKEMFEEDEEEEE